MNSIKKETIHELEIKKSKFICHLQNVYNEEEAKNYINKIKNKHPNATHNCSCYIISSLQKANDDGEPSGTAGIPMLNVLLKNNMDNIVCVVTRYFGGIKLGAGGLIRAYSKSVSQALKESELIKLVKGFLVELTLNFENNDKVNYLLKTNNVEIVDIKYLTNIKYTIKVREKDLAKLKEEINNINHLIKINIKEEILMVDI